RTLLLRCVFLGPPEQLVGVADDPRPAELAHTVHNLGRLCAHQREIAALQRQGRLAELEIPDHGLERGEVAMDVRDDRDPHQPSHAFRKASFPPVSTMSPWPVTILSKSSARMRFTESRAAGLSVTPRRKRRVGPGGPVKRRLFRGASGP